MEVLIFKFNEGRYYLSIKSQYPSGFVHYDLDSGGKKSFAKQFFRPGNILENTDKRSGKWLKVRSFF